MDILTYTEEQNQFRDRLKQFLEREVIPFAEQWERDHIVPKEIWRKMGREGFLCMALPEEYGGINGDFRHSVIVIEELSKTNQNGLATPLHSDIIVPYISTYGSEELKKRYLPGCARGDIITAVAMTEPGAGSDLSSMTATAEEEGGEVVINGSKTFISNGINCELAVVAAKDPGVENPYEAISLYVVDGDTPGFSKGRQLEKMGLHSQDTSELFFSNCRIPVSNRLGDKGTGFYMLMEKLQQERMVVAVMAVAATELILEATIDHCKNTVQNGKPLIKSQATQFSLVEMATEVKLGRTFVDKLVMEHVNGENIVVDTSMAKYWTTDMANRIANRSLDLFGDISMTEKCPIIRTWRDMRVMTIFAGANEIMKGIVAKFMGF
jgi:alkylation response protein AidB-like acyl-CoA dehydrogenase